MKKLMMVAAATVAAWCSRGAESISVDEVANHYPWDGKVDCVYTVSGLVNGYLYDGAFQLSVKKNGETIRRVITNALGKVAGTYTNTFDCTALFGAGYYPNGGIKVALVKKLEVVQLWAGGPYFAPFNVGATQSQDYGYYFWWGDTVGYKRNAANNGWISVKDGSAFTFTSGNCSTMGKNNTTLKNDGWIDANNTLLAAHDAATAHWGAPWRMPTDAEMQALLANCTATLTNNWNGTGVNGKLITGKGDYASRSIFLPYTGSGGSDPEFSSYSYYWSSTPQSDDQDRALGLAINSPGRSYNPRYAGLPVRPVRSAE